MESPNDLVICYPLHLPIGRALASLLAGHAAEATTTMVLNFDEIGYWSEIKLEIVRKYAQAYSTVVANDRYIRKHIYVDAFAGAGLHISKRTGEFVLGSPLNALNVEPPFSEYHFIDLDQEKAEHLRQLAGDRPNTYFYSEDCNTALLNNVFPRAR